jgi:hypothetical protein
MGVPMSKVFKGLFALVAGLGLIAILGAFWGMRDLDRYNSMTPEQKQAAAKEAEAGRVQYAQRRRVENKDGQMCLDGSGENQATVDALVPTLREPDSFEHVSTMIGPVNQDGTHKLVMRYRAKNGFGGVSFGTTKAVVSNVDCSSTIVETNAA